MIFFVFQAIRNACCSAAHLFGPVLGRFVYLVSFLALAFHCLLLWQAGGKTDRQTGSYPPPARPLTVNWCSPSNWDKCVINLPACLPSCLPTSLLDLAQLRSSLFGWKFSVTYRILWLLYDWHSYRAGCECRANIWFRLEVVADFLTHNCRTAVADEREEGQQLFVFALHCFN